MSPQKDPTHNKKYGVQFIYSDGMKGCGNDSGFKIVDGSMEARYVKLDDLTNCIEIIGPNQSLHPDVAEILSL